MNSLLSLSEPVPGLDNNAERLALDIYDRALAHSSVTVPEIAAELHVSNSEVERAVVLLRRLKLITYVDETRARFACVSPDAAQAELAAPLAQAIRQLTGIYGQLKSFADTFNNMRNAQRHDAVVVAKGWEQTRLWLIDAICQCGSEVLTMRPTNASTTWDREPLVNEILQRGVPMCSILPHTARTDADARTYAQDLATAGAQIRTSSDVVDQFWIVDREVVFIPLPHTDRKDQEIAIVYEPAIVGLLCRIFEHTWQSASGFDPCAPAAYGETYEDVKVSILRLLACGLKDDVIARRLGMSSRTFRRHLSAIMNDLKVESRFQAGVEVVRAGLLEIPRSG